MAVLELIPMLVIFMLLVSFTLGFFGVIHTGVLNTISARNYTFETFRHRASLLYLRGNRPDEEYRAYFFKESGVRYHATVSEKNSKQQQFEATERPIRFNLNNQDEGRNPATHSQKVQRVAESTRYIEEGVNPVWIQSQYGICVNAQCGQDPQQGGTR
jgi:hypothetical protein